MQTARWGSNSGLRYTKRTTKQFSVEIEEETTQLTNSRRQKEVVGYLAIWPAQNMKTKVQTKAIMKKDQKDACDGLKGYAKKCPGLTGWHKKTNFDKFTDAETCTALVFTKGKTCKSFCNKQNRVCLFA